MLPWVTKIFIKTTTVVGGTHNSFIIFTSETGQWSEATLPQWVIMNSCQHNNRKKACWFHAIVINIHIYACTYIQLGAVIMWSNMTRYCLQNYSHWAIIWIRDLIHGRAMGCLLGGLGRKLTIYKSTALYVHAYITYIDPYNTLPYHTVSIWNVNPYPGLICLVKYLYFITYFLGMGPILQTT